MNIRTPMTVLICVILLGFIVAFSDTTQSVFSDTETSVGNTMTVNTTYQSTPDPPSCEIVTLLMENINKNVHGNCVHHPQIPPSDLFNLSDVIGGNFTYNDSGPEFVYDFEAVVLCTDREYVLVTFQLKDNPPGQFKPDSGVMLNNGTADAAGVLLLNGTMELDGDLVDTPVFLVLSKEHGFGHGNLGGNWAHDCLYHLYSMGLINYNDTDAVEEP